MHSCREMCAATDVPAMIQVMRAWYDISEISTTRSAGILGDLSPAIVVVDVAVANQDAIVIIRVLRLG